MTDILFFTCANRPYERFIGLYACAVLTLLPTSRVEIGVESVSTCSALPEAARLIELFPGRLKLRDADFSRSIPHTVRFVTEPQTHAEYLYIGDIDIIITDEKLPEWHLNFMRETGLPYSNSVRPNTDRMSGLHFTRCDAYWPLPDISDLDLKRTNDEQVLYQIVKRRGLPVQDKVWKRPVHGVHISPNRPMIHRKGGPPGWGVGPTYRVSFLRLMETDAMKLVYPLLPDQTRSEIDAIRSYYAEAHR